MVGFLPTVISKNEQLQKTTRRAKKLCEMSNAQWFCQCRQFSLFVVVASRCNFKSLESEFISELRKYYSGILTRKSGLMTGVSHSGWRILIFIGEIILFFETKNQALKLGNKRLVFSLNKITFSFLFDALWPRLCSDYLSIYLLWMAWT